MMVASKLSNLLLAGKRVQIADPAKVESKIKKLVEGGFDQLQFIVDFDYTITRAHRDGQMVDCSWGVLENYKALGEDYVKKTSDLRAKYLPIELDLNISLEEKIPHMVEWYTQANRLLTEAGVKKTWYPDMVSSSNCEFRDGTDVLLNTLANKEVPVLILSAGLGDLILEILKHFKADQKNVKVVSNFCEYDENDQVAGLKPPMIHMYNKSESSVDDPLLAKKKNVVLLGDSLGDLHMSEGIENPNVVLTIGFLNKKLEENLPKYKAEFDVVLVDDQTMEFPIALVEEISSSDS